MSSEGQDHGPTGQVLVYIRTVNQMFGAEYQAYDIDSPRPFICAFLFSVRK